VLEVDDDAGDVVVAPPGCLGQRGAAGMAAWALRRQGRWVVNASSTAA
jgi:hypothetical protein